MVPRSFEDVNRAFDVDALVKRRFSEARAHARAGGEVDDLVEFHTAEQFVERGAVGQIAVDEFKRFGERLDVAEVPAFELRVVKRVEVIERPDGVAVAQQPFADVGTNETRAAGDQKIHGRKLTIRRRSVECGDMN